MHFSATPPLVVLVAVFLTGCRTASSPSDDTTTSTSTDIPSGCITPVGEQQPSKTFLLNTIVKMNWHQAMAYCTSMGTSLATLDSQQEYDTLVDLIKKTGAGGELGDFWLGGSDLGSPGQFIWASTGQPMLYSNWNSGEPNRMEHPGTSRSTWLFRPDYTGEVEHCVELGVMQEYRMNDNKCSKLAYLVCQTP